MDSLKQDYEVKRLMALDKGESKTRANANGAIDTNISS